MERKETAYLRLYETIRDEILRGDRKTGDRLPSRRQMAREYSCSEMTAQHSLELLCQEGYADTRPKSGTYVIYRETDGFAAAGVSGAAELARDGSSGADEPEPEGGRPDRSGTFPFSVMAKTMRRVLTEKGEEIMNKSPNSGLYPLRDAICRYLARNRGIRISPDRIVIGSGAEYLYGLVVELLGRDRIFGIESPSYEKIEQVYRARGVECDLLPLGRDGIRTEALRGTGASVLHITPFRSFPSGVTAGASKRREYLRWAETGDRYLVEDDFESEFSLLRKPEETLFARTERDNVIYINTFSMTISPSIRVGYMALPERLKEPFARTAGFYSCPVPAFEQYVLAELLNGGDFERHINRVRRMERNANGKDDPQCT